MQLQVSQCSRWGEPCPPRLKPSGGHGPPYPAAEVKHHGNTAPELRISAKDSDSRPSLGMSSACFISGKRNIKFFGGGIPANAGFDKEVVARLPHLVS